MRRCFERSRRTVGQRSESRPLVATSVLEHDEDCIASPRLFHLPRAARLRKKSADIGPRRCVFPARGCKLAHQATAHIGNLTTPDRLRLVRRASEASVVPNLTMRERENCSSTWRKNGPRPSQSAPRNKPIEHRNPYLIINRCAGKGVALTAGILPG